MRRSIKQVMTPASFQGTNSKAPYFEGWYYKLVDASGNTRLAVIPGMMLDPKPENDQAFIQVMDGETSHVVFKQFPLSAFKPIKNVLDVSLGGNHFSLQHILLDIAQDDFRIKGEVTFGVLAPWPVSIASPGIMGWFAWIPFMQCYHGLVSFDHSLAGKLTINGKEIDFTGGRGYIEKDWGSSFPECWIWMQTNHFTEPGTSLSASIARIPWLGSTFPGYIVGLWHQRELYRFATYNGTKVKRLEMTPEKICWTLTNRTHRLELAADRAGSGLLYAPGDAGMARRVAESLTARVEVRLSTLQGKVLFEDEGCYAGLEVVGDVRRLGAIVQD